MMYSLAGALRKIFDCISVQSDADRTTSDHTITLNLKKWRRFLKTIDGIAKARMHKRILQWKAGIAILIAEQKCQKVTAEMQKLKVQAKKQCEELSFNADYLRSRVAALEEECKRLRQVPEQEAHALKKFDSQHCGKTGKTQAVVEDDQMDELRTLLSPEKRTPSKSSAVVGNPKSGLKAPRLSAALPFGELEKVMKKRMGTALKPSAGKATKPKERGKTSALSRGERKAEKETGTKIATEDPAEQFRKMLKVGVPRPAVEAKMRAAGLDPAALDSTTAPKGGSAKEEEKAGEDPAEQFRKMLKVGVPRPAVEAKMRAAGLDPAALDSTTAPKGGSAKEEEKAGEDPAEQFRKMLKVGVPRPAVEAKMRAAGVSPSRLAGPGPSTPSKSARDLEIAKFKKMLSVGVPLAAVADKMRSVNLSPSMLSTPSGAAAPASTCGAKDAQKGFADMLRSGLPAGVVAARMVSEGLDPSTVLGPSYAASHVTKLNLAVGPQVSPRTSQG